jgi:hypothetical protein
VQYVTAPGHALLLAIRGHAHGNFVTRAFLVVHQTVAAQLFCRGMSISVVDLARPHPKRFGQRFFWQ